MFQIAVPVWAMPFKCSVDPNFTDVEYERVLKQRHAVMAIVHRVVQDYVDDPSLTVDQGAEGFPARSRLTGEYYIEGESYWVNDKIWFTKVGRTCEYRFSVMIHCLEFCQHPNQTARDYLGLEVHFTWISSDGTFLHHGDVDSSSI